MCPYHLQEAGATPVQELAYGLANAIAVLDAVRESGQVPDDEFPEVVGRISFFIDAGVRFVEEMCKMRAFTRMWDQICRERYGVDDEKLRRFRYGMQVNSLGLTEEQPENNVQRIVLEMLGVTLSKDARARAIQLPCWNEALGLPTPWDQQWSLRIQQVLAYESDLLEYGDLFEGSVVVERKVAELCEEAWAELQWVLDGGGSFAMIDEMKGRIVQAGTRARAPHRVGRAEGRRRQLVHRDRAVAARRQRAERRHRHDRSRGRARARRGDRGVAVGARPSARSTPRSRTCRRSRETTENLVPARGRANLKLSALSSKEISGATPADGSRDAASGGSKMKIYAKLLCGTALAVSMLGSASAANLDKVGISVGSLGNPFFVATIKGITDKAKSINPNVRGHIRLVGL